jgi:hypothetical protein
MKRNIQNYNAFFMRYRRIGITVALITLVIASVGVAILGFAGHQLINLGKNNVTHMVKDMREPASSIDFAENGYLGGVVTSIASGWIHQNLAYGDIEKIRNGLACFDALGGPSPNLVINYVKTKIKDEQLLARLNQVADTLSLNAPNTGGSASCTNWIFSG